MDFLKSFSILTSETGCTEKFIFVRPFCQFEAPQINSFALAKEK